MEDVIFVASDFHYGLEQEKVIDPFKVLLTRALEENAWLYLNGDLFNYWFEASKQVPDGVQPFTEAIKSFIEKGGKITVLRGNRDFLMDDVFTQLTGAQLIKDDQLILKDQKILITHGDQFDSNLKYQIFRKIIRSFPIRFISKLVSKRFIENIASSLRNKSKMKSTISRYLPKKFPIKKGYSIILGHYHTKFETLINDTKIIICPAFDETCEYLKISKDQMAFERIAI